MTNAYIVEIISGICSSILLATGYKVYKYIKKNKLFFLDYDNEVELYKIKTEKQGNIIDKNINILENNINSLNHKLNILKKSKMKYDKEKIQEIITMLDGFERLVSIQNTNNNSDIEILVDNTNE